MEHTTPPPATPAPDGAGVPSLSPDQERQAVLDAHGYDPADFDWVPVKRKPRVDGWSAEKQRLFIATLADTGVVAKAARAVGMSIKSAYALRRAPGAEQFDRAWTAAIRHAMQRLIDVCMERALEGSEQPIFDKDGRVIGHRVRHHDRMAMFLLRAHMPDLFRDAHKQDRAQGEMTPPPPEPVADALKRLDPVTPAEPEALMEADVLDDALCVADAMDGKLPHWHRDRDLVAREAEERRAAEPLSPSDISPSDTSPLGEEFERELEAAKNGTWQPPRRPAAGQPGKRARRRRQGQA